MLLGEAVRAQAENTDCLVVGTFENRVALFTIHPHLSMYTVNFTVYIDPLQCKGPSPQFEQNFVQQSNYLATIAIICSAIATVCATVSTFGATIVSICATVLPVCAAIASISGTTVTICGTIVTIC